MINLRFLIAAFILGGVLFPLGPSALAHAWSDVHVHRHAGGNTHSHDHDTDHHEHEQEFDTDASREARLRPSTTMRTDRDVFSPLLSAAPAVAEPRLASPLSASRLPGASPGRRGLPHLGRAPPA